MRRSFISSPVAVALALALASHSIVGHAQTAAPLPPPGPAPAVPQPTTVKITITTVPPQKKVFVLWGKKRLGMIAPKAPLILQRPRDSGPLDLLIQCEGFVTVQTRAYTFADTKLIVKLTPLDQKNTILGYREEVPPPPPPDAGVPTAPPLAAPPPGVAAPPPGVAAPPPGVAAPRNDAGAR